MKTLIILSTLLILLLTTTCALHNRQQPSDWYEAFANVHHRSGAPFRITNSDLPPVGESLFDWLIGSRLNPTPGEIPYPFERLRELIEAIPGQVAKPGPTSSRSVSVLIPLGRSLQRFAADPEYFKFPRLILAADTESDNDEWPNLAGKLFVAFAEATNQLEIISFNEMLGRFEFQIVRDYAHGQTPRLFYAHRDACISCHAGRSPIFPDFPWLETNSTTEVAAAIEKHTGPAYHGVKVRQRSMVDGLFSTADSGADFDTESLGVEDLVRWGSELALAHELWMQVSQALNPASKEKFMAKAFALGLMNSLFQLLPVQRAELEREVFKAMLASGTQSFDVLTMNSAFDGVALNAERIVPLAVKVAKGENDQSAERRFLDRSADGLKAAVFKATKISLAEHVQLTLWDSFYLNPLGSLLDKPTRQLLAKEAQRRFPSSHAAPSILTLLEKVAEICNTHADCSFRQPTFRSKVFLHEVNQVLGTKAFHVNKTETALSSFSVNRRLDPLHSALPDQVSDPGLKLMLTYCGRCHSNPAEGRRQSFLFGLNEHEIAERLQPRKADALYRIQSAHERQMPPLNTLEWDTLQTQPDRRRALEEFLK